MTGKKRETICIFVDEYPTEDDPVYTFIRPVAHGFADMGKLVYVICPFSVTNAILHKRKMRPYRWIDRTDKGNEVIIFQPGFLSISNIKIAGHNLSYLLRDRAVKKIFKREKIEADIFYSHFWHQAVVACRQAAGRIPVYTATGEADIWVFDIYPQKYVFNCISGVEGVIGVSTNNIDKSAALGLLQYQPRTTVLPNAVETADFRKMDRLKVREKLGISASETVAAFVGWFSERKGVLRVLEAAEKVPGLKLILIGTGEQEPQGDCILFKGRVPHHQVAEYLNAADMFILPTQMEGCSNAVVEAMACGLPIISSDRDFNKDILNETNAILIDPMNIDEIVAALQKLAASPELREKLGDNALNTAKELTIENRCRRINEFLHL